MLGESGKMGGLEVGPDGCNQHPSDPVHTQFAGGEPRMTFSQSTVSTPTSVYPSYRSLRTRWLAVEIPAPSTMLSFRRWSIPRLPGVYAVYRGEALVYIGSSINLRSRLQTHFSLRHWRHSDVSVKVSAMDAGWRERERKLVKRLRPPNNRQWAPENGQIVRAGWW